MKFETVRIYFFFRFVVIQKFYYHGNMMKRLLLSIADQFRHSY